ncbi:hypothetical protein AB0C77_31230, partial [Streptomyces sp. NPDC048629]
ACAVSAADRGHAVTLFDRGGEIGGQLNVAKQAAEQGVPGVVLLGAAYGWLLWGLASSPRPTSVVLTAGATLAALAVVASVGNALSFTPVTVAAGLLAGLATAREPAATSTGPDDAEP